jgi:hypothetical protein
MQDSTPERDDPFEGAACPRVADVPAYAQGELSPSEQASFEGHLETCAACREELREVSAVLQGLRDLPSPSGPVDLVPEVISAWRREGLPASRRRRRRPVLAGLAAAAALVCIAVLARILVKGPMLGVHRGEETRPTASSGPGEMPAALAEAIDWLERTQEPSGGWRAERWEGESRYDVGLTGLALLALLDESHDGAASSSRRPAIDRAVKFLLGQQAEGGRFGPAIPAALYNHGIASVAVLETFGCHREERLREPIDRALRYIREGQTAGGGWGYLGDPSGETNTSVTTWPLQALLIARSLGWEGLDDSIAGGFRHLKRVCDDRGRLGYRKPGEFQRGSEGLSSMGAFCVLLDRKGTMFPAEMRNRVVDALARARGASREEVDLYRDFFLASALKATPARLQGPWLAETRSSLASRQVREGHDRGSWDPDDPWGSLGGRLYSTALSALVLQVERRGDRLASWAARG